MKRLLEIDEPRVRPAENRRLLVGRSPGVKCMNATNYESVLVFPRRERAEDRRVP